MRLIGKSNGVGLTRDFELLAAALRAADCSVSVHCCERLERRRRRALSTWIAARLRHLRAQRRLAPSAAWDVNIMLEHVWPQFLHQARCNVLVPNPEWFDRRDQAFLSAIDRIWAKSALAEQLFGARGCASVRIGFDSEDRLAAQGDALAQAPPRREFLHLAGRSALKGTRRLLSLWQRHPEWPTLTVLWDVGRPLDAAAAARAPNVVYQHEYLSDEAVRVQQNQHRFHLCPSEAEGWGHYIAEALSVGAVTLTTDAAPMNELVTAERGLLVASEWGDAHNLARLALFDEAALEQAVQRALAFDETQLRSIGEHARGWFLDNKRGFAGRVRGAVADIAALARAAA